MIQVLFLFVYLCLYSYFHWFILYRLFFGSDHPINVTSIRIIEDNLNLEEVIGAISALDDIISNKIDSETEDKISSSCGFGLKLSVLFDYILYGRKEKNWNQYIFDTFHCFAKSKIKIDIKLQGLKFYVQDRDLLNLIFYKLAFKNKEIMHEENVTNSIRPEIFKVFDNAKEITIRTGSGGGYGFSLFGFVSLITKTKINKATITGRWITDLWISSEEEIMTKMSAGQFKAEYDKNKDALIIDKL